MPEAPTPVAGATIFDPQGAVIGTIEMVTADVVVVNTGAHTVGLPPAAVGSNEKGLVASTTKADLDAAAEKAQADAAAQLQALLVAGTVVNSSDGQPVGTIKQADAEFVTVTTSKGVDAKLPANAFSLGESGGLTLAMTAENFNAAVAGSAPAP
ncbi:hypothetical protein ACFO8O_04620 [Hephaestia sp. GCM10023244]|uniref:hypothetical protein n=1 Tax=unclassified Hephaestia TaxID=2631281 RepID=UPI002076E071|nr:hypothetical protein [Hephaestia sp. MAHUQ-44]MCM8730250.1 hypothetical protein [Hephaestia sp. MAHUQ-44]